MEFKGKKYVKNTEIIVHIIIFAGISFYKKMKNRIIVLGFAAMALVSCRAPMNIAKIQTQKNISIGQSIPDDGATAIVIEPYKRSLESQMNTKISYTSAELTKQGDNSSLGNLLADYTLQGANEWAAKNNIPKVDAAVINIGGIRTNIGQGDILLRHIYEVMPFENELVLVKMTGAQLQGMFDYYLETQKNNPVSNMVIETESRKLSRTLIGGNTINPTQTYYIATSDYLALGGDNMKFFNAGEMITTGVKLRDMYIDKFRQNSEITAPTDLRLIFKGKTQK